MKACLTESSAGVPWLSYSDPRVFDRGIFPKQVLAVYIRWRVALQGLVNTLERPLQQSEQH